MSIQSAPKARHPKPVSISRLIERKVKAKLINKATAEASPPAQRKQAKLTPETKKKARELRRRRTKLAMKAALFTKTLSNGKSVFLQQPRIEWGSPEQDWYVPSQLANLLGMTRADIMAAIGNIKIAARIHTVQGRTVYYISQRQALRYVNVMGINPKRLYRNSSRTQGLINSMADDDVNQNYYTQKTNLFWIKRARKDSLATAYIATMLSTISGMTIRDNSAKLELPFRVTQKRLAEICELSPPTVARSVKYLKANRLITVNTQGRYAASITLLDHRPKKSPKQAKDEIDELRRHKCTDLVGGGDDSYQAAKARDRKKLKTIIFRPS